MKPVMVVGSSLETKTFLLCGSGWNRVGIKLDRIAGCFIRLEKTSMPILQQIQVFVHEDLV